MAVERRRSHELVRSMVVAVYVDVLRTLAERADCESGDAYGKEIGGEEAESLQQRRGVGGGSCQEEPLEEEK